MAYQNLNSPPGAPAQGPQYVNIVPWLGAKCSLNIEGTGWIQRIPVSVFQIGGGRHSQPTVHCTSWDGAVFETYPLILVKGIQ